MKLPARPTGLFCQTVSEGYSELCARPKYEAYGAYGGKVVVLIEHPDYDRHINRTSTKFPTDEAPTEFPPSSSEPVRQQTSFLFTLLRFSAVRVCLLITSVESISQD